MPIAADGDLPITVTDPLNISCSRRPILRIVVLCATSDVIERIVVIDGHFVKLRQRQIWAEQPCPAVIIGTVNATVAAHQKKILVGGVKSNRVIVYVLVAAFDIDPRVSVVFTPHEIVVCLIQHTKPVGISPQLLVVVRSRSTGDKVIGFGPTGTFVVAAPETTFSTRQFDCGIDIVVLLRRNLQGDLAHVSTGQTLAQRVPRFTSIN